MRLSKITWLTKTPIAHRGLWNDKITENTLPAYKNAIDNGFPIEIDVFMTKDNHLVCFHDDNLKRMTGVDDFIYNKTLLELKELNLSSNGDKIPTLKEVLNLCEGMTPLLIELKDQPNKNLVLAVTNELKNYKGEFAIQSFNPFYLMKIKKLAPEFVIGILGTESHASDKPFFTRFTLKRLIFNPIIKPHFISYSHTGIKKIKRKAKKLPLIAWTVTSEKELNKAKLFADNVIFENFIPKL